MAGPSTPSETVAGGGLRGRLRRDTRAAHDRLDAAYGGCDLARAEGLGRFLTGQLGALRALTIAAGPHAAEALAFRDGLCVLLHRDLAALGLDAPPPARPLTVTADAALYVMLGSRRGAQLLRRDWDQRATGAARLAGAFLGADPRNAEWRALCDRLTATPEGDGPADRTVADAEALLMLFAEALPAHGGTAVPFAQARAQSAPAVPASALDRTEPPPSPFARKEPVHAETTR